MCTTVKKCTGQCVPLPRQVSPRMVSGGYLPAVGLGELSHLAGCTPTARYRHLVGKCVRIHNFTEKGVIFSDFACLRNQEKGVFFFNRIREFKKRGTFLPGRVRLPVGNTDVRLALCRQSIHPSLYSIQRWTPLCVNSWCALKPL